MNEIKITVNGIEKKEYIQATQLMLKRVFLILGTVMLVFCAIIIFAMDDFTLKAVLGPVAIYAVIVALCEAFLILGYKGQLETVNPVEYTISEKEWQIETAEEIIIIPWECTPKMVKTKDGVFLYNDEVSSNIIPKRLLTKENINDIENWYKASRASYKKYDKEKTADEKIKFREEHRWIQFWTAEGRKQLREKFYGKKYL